jgi:protein involved in polysaccharide export with SLBB domain
MPENAVIFPYFEKEYSNQKFKSKHFGYNFFTLRDSISFWENIPTPKSFILGPGDELVVFMWGETQIRQTYTISRDGKIYDEKIGLINLTGQTLESAKSSLKNQFGRVYATLNGSNPTTFIDISLGELHSINVNFVGALNYPGVYSIHPFSNVITGLIQSGGPDTTGSLRQIQIRRNGKLLDDIDLYKYFITGDLSSSIQLRDQDIVIIPPRKSYVIIDSSVHRPGIYESIKGEMVSDLISFAGGLSFDSLDRISVQSKFNKNIRNSDNYAEGSYVDYVTTKKIPVYNGDVITVLKSFADERKVEIIGQVKNPGYYNYYNGMYLSDLIKISSGFEDSTFWKSVYSNRAELVRRNPKTRYETVIEFNLADFIIADISKDIELQNLDRIEIHANLNFFEKDNIQINGEVNIPGSYPLVKDAESLESLINRAGGLTTKALDDGISIYRKKSYNNEDYDIIEPLTFKSYENTSTNLNISENNNLINKEDNSKDKIKDSKVRVAWNNTNIALMPGDSIVVKEKTSTVYVAGAVYNPGVVEFRNKKSLRYYINAAGGLTKDANKKGIIVLYANGSVKQKQWHSVPKVLDGSTIIINWEKKEEPFDLTQFATNWTSIISSMITAIILTRQL